MTELQNTTKPLKPKSDRTVSKYLSMPETVMRNGKLIIINEHNSMCSINKP